LKLKKIREKAQKKLKKTHTVDDYTVAFSRDKAENKIGKPQVCCSLGDSSKQNRTLNIISIFIISKNIFRKKKLPREFEVAKSFVLK
jgi:hypothetical protein